MKAYLITGGAGYIGSLLTGILLQQGHHVTVVDELLFGGDSLLAYWQHPNFNFIKADVTDSEQVKKIFSDSKNLDAVVHLAAIVGFPACQAVGREVAFCYNVDDPVIVVEYRGCSRK